MMNRKRALLLALGMALVVFSIVAIRNLTLAKSILALDNFTAISRYVALTIAALFFLAAVGSAALESDTRSAQPGKLTLAWTMGFILVVSVALGLIFYVDPHARLGDDRFPSVTPSARTVKTELYGQLSDDPDIVILGSSRAFTLSPSYIEEKIEHSAFNMSVEGGRLWDFAIQLNFMRKSGSLPRALILDVNEETLLSGPKYLDTQPLTLLPYMPASLASSVGARAPQEMISLQSLSDSIYLLSFPDLKNRPRAWTFQNDGMGIRREISHNLYLELMNSETKARMNGMFCRQLNPSAMSLFDQLIRQAQEDNIAIVMFESPVHSQFFQVAHDKNPGGFDACRELLDGYFQSLAEKYPNVFFVNLFHYEQVGQMGENGFYDPVHLRPNAAQLVVDALAPEIQKAMDWALTERSQP